jgi:hypothetical protein
VVDERLDIALVSLAAFVRRKEYTAEQCKQLAELRPYLNRCMGGSIYG